MSTQIDVLVDANLRCEDCFEVQVTRIIDGDTLDTSRRRVRLFGVQLPERGQRCATGATERLRELAGGTVRLEDEPRLTDPYGRTLAYVYAEDGASIDATLTSPVTLPLSQLRCPPTAH